MKDSLKESFEFLISEFYSSLSPYKQYLYSASSFKAVEK